MKKIAILLISLMLFTSGCAVMTAAAPEPTPAPPTVEELLADALKYYNAGNYEEAILLYEAAIEIEPRNFDATVGLGKAYRSTGNNGQAVETLKAAYELNDSPDVAFELGCAYIANGQYTYAENLASELWKDGEGDAEAGIITIICKMISAENMGAYQDIITALQNDKIQKILLNLQVSGFTYLGSYDGNGKPSGRGVGIYAGGYIYVGEYKDGVRCGQGTWYYPSGEKYFNGEWKDDYPNGVGDAFENLNNHTGYFDVMYGSFVDGYAEGTFSLTVMSTSKEGLICYDTSYLYECKKGVPQPLGTADGKDGLKKGDTIMAYMTDDGGESFKSAPHYWARLRCVDCGEEPTDEKTPKWYKKRNDHAWAGWSEEMVFCVEGATKE